MRLISYLTTFLLAALLTACGGGGGSPGLSSGSASVFTVLAPATVTLQLGTNQQYGISGGVKPYSVFSTDPATAVGWIGGDDTVSVGAIKAGAATVTVADAKGTKFDIAVTATTGPVKALYTTASGTVTIPPGAANAQTYVVGGGTAPYTATSSFPSVVTATISGSQLTITSLKISAAPVTVTIRDDAGATVTVSVTAGTLPLTVNPTSISAFIGDKLRAIITGGTTPYRAQTTIDESALKVQIVNGNTLELVGGQEVTAAGVTVIDANNQTAELKLTLAAGQDVLRVQPNSLTINESNSTPNITLMVYGASAAGGIQVFHTFSAGFAATTPSKLAPGTPTTNADNTGYAVTLGGGDTCANSLAGDRTVTITVIDAKGKVGSSTLTVKDLSGAAGC